MNETQLSPPRASVEPLPPNIRSTQPGGGFCCGVELAWGRWRRWSLQRFRPGYVRRLAELRKGSPDGCPHPVLDPRDLKYHRNQCDCRWPAEHDPFLWRERLGFARWGLAEIQIMGWPLLAACVALSFTWWYLAPIPLIVLLWLLWFFRNPRRRIPTDAGAVISPADGTVAEISTLDFDEFVGGPAVRIGIFLSIFNVHINRSPLRCKVIALRYSRGEFLNAMNPASSLRNENMWIGLEEEEQPHRKLVLRQIAGAIARRIVCDARPGQVLERGEPFGMIKLGSRTEIILPAEDLHVDVTIGQRLKAGASVLARYNAN
jgi:phosphatidylserine decarboxylase